MNTPCFEHQTETSGAILKMPPLRLSTFVHWMTKLVIGLGLLMPASYYGQGAVPDLRNQTAEMLRKSHAKWTNDAISSYWRVNQRRLEITAEIDHSLLESELKGLARLPHDARIMQLIREHPETANLCALAGDPKALASTLMDLRNEADREAIIITYTTLTNQDDIDVWTRAVARHGRVIAHLIRYCPALPVHGIFCHQVELRLAEARETYGKWLNEVLDPGVLGTDEDEIASRLDFVGCVGPGLRDRLVGSDGSVFRAHFEKSIWPRCRDTLVDYKQQSKKNGAGSPWYVMGRWEGLWDFFQRDDARELLLTGGSDAVILLSGRDAIHKDLQKLTADLLKKRSDLAARMYPFAKNPGFVTLASSLESDLQLLNALVRHLERHANWESEIAKLRNLTREGALKRGITPVEASVIPGVSLFRIIEKGMDGREINGGDWLSAGFDVFDFVTLGVSIEFTAAGKAAMITRGAVKQTLRTGAQEGLEKLAQRGVKELTKAETTEASQYLVKQSLQMMPKEMQEAFVKATLVDISGPIKQGFKLCQSMGFGSASFKRFTSLEARLFARKDGRVFVSLTGAVTSKNPALRFLWIIGDNHVLNSDLVQDAAGSGVSVAVKEYHALQANLSAWWAAVATGQLSNP